MPDDVLVRACVAMDRMATTLANIMAMHTGVELRWDGDLKEWRADVVQPVVWFGESFLCGRVAGPWTVGPWTIDDGMVRLRASNGEWLWRLTDEWSSAAGVDGPLDLRKAVWPD
ncbi:MAG: hypothetical protein JHC55_01170 [Mycolicibacterium sp.]|nr:hypothetical protein [Mycolicibacterium sp.]